MENEKQEEFEKIPEKKVKLEKQVKRTKKNSLLQVMEYIQNTWDFRFNTFATKLEFKKKNAPVKDFVFLDERAYHNIITSIKLDAGYDVTENDFRALIGSEKISESFDPIKSYLFGLPNWDEKTDHIEIFLRQIQLLDESQRPFLNKTFKKWFVMLVASLVDDKVINDTCFVLSGKQGRGKTRFLETLVPEHLRFFYSYSGTFDPHDKDHKEMISTKIQIILDEMETLTRTEQGTLKSTMSNKNTDIRRAYGRTSNVMYRRASFCGSINFDDFLTDTTGNRRWLPFSIHNIDVDYTFNIDLIYAQALSLYRSKFQTWFAQDEIVELEKHNERFRKMSPEEELILVNYRKPSKEEIEKDQYLLMNATQIMHDLSSREEYKKMNVNDTIRSRIGRILNKLEYGTIQKRDEDSNSPAKRYLIVKIDQVTKENSIKPDSMSNSEFLL